MFALEDTYARKKRKSIEKAREEFRVNSQRQWRPDEPSDAEGINLPGRCAFAQNNTYLEFPDGHPKLLHLWPVKLLQAGRSDYDDSGVMAMRAAASFRR